MIEQLKNEDPNHPNLPVFVKILRAQAQYANADNTFPNSGSNAPFVPPQQPQQQQQPPPPPPSRAPSSISQNQLLQLKAQILAYKYLVRNLALPPKLLSAIRNFNILKTSQVS